MSPYRDPPRWKSDAGADPVLRRALRAATRDRPSRADVKWMASALSVRLGLGPVPPNVAQPGPVQVIAPAAKAGLLGKAAGVLVVSSAIVGGGLWAARTVHAPYLPAALQAPAQPQAEPASAPIANNVVETTHAAAITEQRSDRWLTLPTRRLDVRPQSARARERSNARAGVAVDERDEQVAVRPPPPVETAPAAPAPAETTPPPRPAVAKEPSETEILMMARRTLVTDPAAALGWVHEHERRFPSPVLAQEREIIAIDALRRLNRVREASARSDRFFARYPSSIHGRSIESPVAVSTAASPLAPSVPR